MAHRLNIEQILRLLKAAREIDELHWLAMAVGFNHGLRASEVVAITPACIVEGKLVMPRRKGSNDENAKLRVHKNPLISEREALLALAAKTPEKQKLFSITTRTFQRWVHTAGKRAGLPEMFCHPHILKHSKLFFLRRKGLDLDQLQVESGHKSVDSLNIYSGFNSDEIEPLVDAAFDSIPA